MPFHLQVLCLRCVDQERCLPGEHLRLERVLGVKVGRGQVQLAASGIVGRELQHVFGVAWPHAGLDNQHGMRAADDADVRHQLHPLVRDYH